MGLSKFLDPKNDFAFKKIFGNEKNKNILISFLNDIFGFKKGEQIKEVTFLNNVLDPETQAKKQSIVDVLCIDEAGTQYIVEMQVARSKGFEKRAQYYAAKAYVNQMKEGDAYHDLKEIIFVAITDFVMFPEKKDYRSNHVTLDKDSLHHDLKDFSFCFLELPKFTKTIDELTSNMDKWMYFFKHAPENTAVEMVKAMGENTAIRDAYKVVDRYFWSEKEINTYDHVKKIDMDNKAVMEAALDQQYAEGTMKGRMEGRVEGRVEGRMEGKVEGKYEALQVVVEKLRARNMSVDEITMITGLSAKEIEEIISGKA
jgi:predicted transposase/invertase (TIGR01784 family)